MSNEIQLNAGPYKTTFTGLQMERASTPKEWENYGLILQKIDEAKQWAIGDWLCDGKKHYGDKLYEKASSLLGLTSQALNDIKITTERFEFSRRRENLSFSLYREVLPLKKIINDKNKLKWSDEFDKEKADEFLLKAEREKMTIRELRSAVNEYKRLQDEMIRMANEPEKFSLIYADPPWRYDNSGFEMSAENKYPTMSIDELCKMRIKDVASEDAVLLMWVTNPLLEECFDVIKSWGFEYKSNIVWTKDHHTAGFYVFGQHELLLICTRGTNNLPSEMIKSIITGNNDIHSKKPHEVYEIIEKMYPHRKYLELFARNKRDGWQSWGNQVDI